MHDWLITAGRMVDVETGADGPGWVAVDGTRIAATGRLPQPPPAARDSARFEDGILLPGLVDLHAHPALSCSRYGIDPDAHMLARGTTTVLSQGDAGARNWQRYRREVVEGRHTRVRMALHLARNGESDPDGPFPSLDEADVEACIAAFEEDASGALWGVSVNCSRGSCGQSEPREILRRGLEVAGRTARPLLFGPRRAPDWALEEQLTLLRSGDVLTYCTDPGANCLVREGRVADPVREAHARGVRFDLGHGMASFDFEVLEAMLADGFSPDTISSDLYARHLGLEPRHDLPLVMSKVVAAGMSEAQIWPRVTLRPAEILGLVHEIGTLAPGKCADLCVLRIAAAPVQFTDPAGHRREGRHYHPMFTLRAGEPVTA